MYTVQLRNSILGWMLVPVSQNGSTILNQLYMQDWNKLKPSERAFMKGEPIESVIAHIKDVCKDMKIGASFCGKKAGPTIRLWWNPIQYVKPETISVDLKWSCWTEDKSVWDEYAPGVYQKMADAFTGKSKPVEINSGPRKEIRYGCIVISKGQATGHFCTEWDDAESLAETLNIEPDDAFREMIPFSSHNMEPGMDWEFKVKARKFTTLIRAIDKEENKLLEMDEREWGYIKNCFNPTT